MNVFDFDKTIYDGDSTVDFWKFCFWRVPGVRKHLFHTAGALCRYGLKQIDKTAFKEDFYRFLTEIGDVDAMLNEFWETHKENIKPWYLKMQKEDDLVISASPEFLLGPICRTLGIRHLMASRVDPHTGKYTGVNCDGEEKVRRFREAYRGGHIKEFYSDSYHDTPLASLAEDAIRVIGFDMEAWSEKELQKYRENQKK